MTESGLVQDQEPWSFGDSFTSIARKAIELRYQLLPYLYTAFRRNVQTGEPVLLPLSFYDQKDTHAAEYEEAFIFGRKVLVSPVTAPDTRAKQVYLPKNDWYNFWTSEFFEGQEAINVATPLDQIPVFVQAGTVLPFAPVMQYTNERPIDEMTLKVYFKDGLAKSELYQDAGDGYGYLADDYTLHEFELVGSDTEMILRQDKSGKRRPDYSTFKLELIGLPFEPKSCNVDGKIVAIENNSCVVAADFKTITIK